MKPWLTVAEAAEYAGLSRDTIYTACERREIRHVRRRWTTGHSSETRMDRRVAGAARAGRPGPTRGRWNALARGRAVGGHIMRAALTNVEGITRADRVLNSQHESRRAALPVLLTVDEAADLLRTTRRAIYAMIERRQLPGVIRVRRRVLLRADDLLDWLNQKRAPSPEE